MHATTQVATDQSILLRHDSNGVTTLTLNRPQQYNALSLALLIDLQAAIDAPFLDTRARIETLYLAALTRGPRPDELAEIEPYVEQAGSETGKKQALADVFWALLNSAEFALNH